MEYVYFGKTGIRVSELCLGTMTFGNEADEDASRAILDRAFESGVNFIDTADVYTRGTTEKIIGRWMGKRRKEIVLASKVHYPTGEGVNERGSSRLHILRDEPAAVPDPEDADPDFLPQLELSERLTHHDAGRGRLRDLQLVELADHVGHGIAPVRAAHECLPHHLGQLQDMGGTRQL